MTPGKSLAERAAEALSNLAKAMFYLVVYYVVQFAVLYAAQIALILYHAGDAVTQEGFLRLLAESMDRFSQVFTLQIYAVLILFYSVFFFARKKNLAAEVSLVKISKKAVPLSLLLGLLACVGITVLINVIPWPEKMLGDYAENLDAITGGSLPLQLLNVVILAPLTEEIVFRGLIFSRLRRSFPAWVASGVSALIFGVAHGNPIHIAYAFVLGLFLALLRERAGSLLAPLLCHVAFNGTSYLLMLLPEKMPLLLLLAFAVLSLAFVIGCTVLLIRDKIPLKATAETDDFPFYDELPDEPASEPNLSLSDFIENEDDDDDSV